MTVSISALWRAASWTICSPCRLTTQAVVNIGLEHLAGSATAMSGAEIAFELTNVINERFGDGKKFDFSELIHQTLRLYRGGDNSTSIDAEYPRCIGGPYNPEQR